MWTHDILISTAELEELRDRLGPAIADAERDGKSVVIPTITASHVEREEESVIELSTEA